MKDTVSDAPDAPTPTARFVFCELPLNEAEEEEKRKGPKENQKRRMKMLFKYIELVIGVMVQLRSSCAKNRHSSRSVLKLYAIIS